MVGAIRVNMLLGMVDEGGTVSKVVHVTFSNTYLIGGLIMEEVDNGHYLFPDDLAGFKTFMALTCQWDSYTYI